MGSINYTEEEFVSKEELIQKLKGISDDADEKEIWDVALDTIEALIERTKTKIDDIILLPIIKIIRKRLGIPDND